ncbi:CCA tRNA nucleotidyltransferase [Lignipirellula cremea]|uniref:tRNA nucleotidyltransferase/poly(A) polymerase n=1 Tax=Lignipirellula cremea TaxID=2528010 RepID=A0A518DR09_9BACT|nr:CCA tRNA nucleotidyltransferase [Lignipirellula cremea]QDU94275.1 tRNA nucleotidyltransferase/poly(A) polymerase [Lignipirellula cremea]
MPESPEASRLFAVEVVRILRDAGYEACWAGGCVRDQLLGKTPKDYDVATSARPEQVRSVFGRSRTIPIGAAFGVMTVLGPREANPIEVATFREDSDYSDGRRPDRVAYSTAEADAQRRDFTINGLFFDPLEERVIDYIDGQRDLHDGVVKAIGDPYERIAEDKLRMLRAIRFTANFRFTMDEATWQAVRREAPLIHKVSPERIAAELRRMLVNGQRATALLLLRDSRLLAEILPESEDVFAEGTDDQGDAPSRWTTTLALLDALREPTFSVGLAALFFEICEQGRTCRPAEAACRRWRLSNEESKGALFLLQHALTVVAAQRMPWSQVQRLLVSPRAAELVDFAAAVGQVISGEQAGVALCRERLAWPAEELNPPTLLTGNELKAAGVPTGPYYKALLDAVRDAQLDGQILTAEDAAAFAHQHWSQLQGKPG